MARRKKYCTPEERLDQVLLEINECKNTLELLNNEKIQLEKEINKIRLERLDELIRNSGKTYDDIVLMLNA